MDLAAKLHELASALRSRVEIKPVAHNGGVSYQAWLGDKYIGGIGVSHKGTTPKVISSQISQGLRGMGLGKKVYGEVMRRQPEGRLHSDHNVSESAQRVWESIKKNPKYKVRKRMVSGSTSVSDDRPIYSGRINPKARIK